MNLEPAGSGWRIGIAATEKLEITVELSDKDEIVFDRPCRIAPDGPFVAIVPLYGHFHETDLILRVLNVHGRELIRYQPIERQKTALPEPASEPPAPPAIGSNDDLYFTGLHLEQYRHATRHPEPYWSEELRRDPGDSRCNAIGLLLLRRGLFVKAEEHFRRAIATVTRRNSNSRDGEPYYNLGIALRYQGKDAAAYAAFYKAAWNHAWESAAYSSSQRSTASVGITQARSSTRSGLCVQIPRTSNRAI